MSDLEIIVKDMVEIQKKTFKKIKDRLDAKDCDTNDIKLALQLLKENSFVFKPSQKTNKIEIIEDMELMYDALPFKEIESRKE